MTNTIEVRPQRFGGRSSFRVSFAHATVAQPSTRSLSGTPLAVPESQAYYWTRRWQDDEMESRVELSAGLGVAFDDPADAIEWLRSDDD